MKKNHLLLLMATTLLIFSNLGCKSLKETVNQFKPVSTTDQQYMATEQNLSQLNGMQAQVGLHIDNDFILQYLPAEIKKNTEAINDDKLTVHEFDPVITFDQQGIFLKGKFSLTIKEQQIKISGTLNGVISPFLEGDSLYLRTALSSLNVKSISYDRKPGLTKQVLAAIIVPALKYLITTANGVFLRKPFSVYLPVQQTYQFDITKMFKDPEIEISAIPVELFRHPKKTAIRVRSNSISVLVELDKNKPGPVTVLPNPATNRFTSAQLRKKFEEFDSKFDSNWLAALDTIPQNTAVTAMIRKSEISNLINEALINPFEVKRALVIPQVKFNEKIEMKSSDINCQAVRTPFSYPDFNGDKCDWDCMHRVFGVRVEDPACAASRRACKLRRETQRIAWQAARETARIAHQVENEAKVGACNIWRTATGLVALGRFEGDADGSGNGQLKFSGVNVNPELSRISFGYSGAVDMKLGASLQMTPLDLGHIFLCFARYNKSISSNVSVTIPQATSGVSIRPEMEGDKLKLNMSLDPISYQASLSPNPLDQLFSDPAFRVQCPIFSTLLQVGIVGAAVGNFLGMIKLSPEQKLLLTGSAKGEYALKEMSIPIQPLIFRINQGEDKKSLIGWKNKTIQFTYNQAVAE